MVIHLQSLATGTFFPFSRRFVASNLQPLFSVGGITDLDLPGLVN
jgi:hypothetical protein